MPPGTPGSKLESGRLTTPRRWPDRKDDEWTIPDRASPQTRQKREGVRYPSRLTRFFHVLGINCTRRPVQRSNELSTPTPRLRGWKCTIHPRGFQAHCATVKMAQLYPEYAAVASPRSYSTRRPARARPNVMLSAYSRSLPTGRPLAGRVTETPIGVSRRCR